MDSFEKVRHTQSKGFGLNQLLILPKERALPKLDAISIPLCTRFNTLCRVEKANFLSK